MEWAADNDSMSDEAVPNAELIKEMHEAVDRILKGIRDPEAICEACERMDRMREELHKRHGLMNLAVPLIRELRGELPDA